MKSSNPLNKFKVSERLLNWLTNLRVKVSDSGTGFQALSRDLAVQLELRGKCIRGIFVLELAAMGSTDCRSTC
jgi:hypothetical protein